MKTIQSKLKLNIELIIEHQKNHILDIIELKDRISDSILILAPDYFENGIRTNGGLDRPIILKSKANYKKISSRKQTHNCQK